MNIPIESKTRCSAGMYRIRFWSPIRPDIKNFSDVDWVSFLIQTEPDYPNEINCGNAKKYLIWNTSCNRKNYDISKSYSQQSSILVSLGEMQCYMAPGILTFRLRKSQFSSNL